ncbi:ImmA/IrrE family metallo-endopeptidase [Alicyclobacillus pomorum]|uniref:ImmA/IrrE family metallo-endopeptidase n=1 Tax=Alicyclobacillus pomorum TaxID=204470 RepID=UPI0004059EBB|nr:ImmA/IrrE family metallo-endopeptidase [Alicyclobacillus pomorum]
MLQLQYYRPTPLEAAIVDFYRKNHVKSPQDIDLEMFAWDAGVWIHYSSMPTTHIETDHNMYSIIVDNRLPWELQKVQLAHELGHVLLHAGRQEFLREDFRALQEWQADKFAAYALVPTFMIANCWVEASSREQQVSQLAYHFDVPETFMDGRLGLLERRMQALAAEAQLAAAIAEERATYDYSYRNHFNPSIEYLVKDGRVIGRRRRAAL